MSNNGLIPFKENNIFAKIIGFFKKIFFRNKNKENIIESSSNEINANEVIKKDTFKEDIIIREENKVKTNIELLKRYRNGDIDEEEMTDEEFDILCNTYEEQIEKLKRSNKIRKERLLAYRRMQINS